MNNTKQFYIISLKPISADDKAKVKGKLVLNPISTFNHTHTNEEAEERVKGQHYLLTRRSKTLTAEDIDTMSDEEIRNLFMNLRWGVEGKQGCPSCGVLDEHYYLSTRRVYKCKHCAKQFSLTSGTAFHSRKLSLKKILKMILKFILNVKGISAISISREFDVTYKVAYTWLHKFRTMSKTSCINLFNKTKDIVSDVHMDGTYVSTNKRKANKKEDRKDARLAKNANKNKRCVFALVKNNPFDSEDVGSKAILPFIITSEKTELVNKITRKFIKEGTRICADESPAYDELIMYYDLQRVSHSKEFCSDDGITNNQAESFFARLKRGLKGQYHKMNAKYLDLYAFEFAFRENMRRMDSLSTVCELLQCGLQEVTRNVMRGYNHSTSTKKDMLYD